LDFIAEENTQICRDSLLTGLIHYCSRFGVLWKTISLVEVEFLRKAKVLLEGG
jgi:hypothetical protein